MSRFKSKYPYRNISDSNNKRFISNEEFRSSDDCDISQKIKSLELEGLKLRSQVEEILQETSEVQSGRTSDITMDTTVTGCDDSGRQLPRYSRPRSEYSDCGTGEEYRHRVEQLQHRLKEDSLAHHLETERLCADIEELKRANGRLQTEIGVKNHECRAQEKGQHTMIERLRCHLTQLLEVNKKQEQTLCETGAKLEELNGTQSAMRAFEDLKDLLIDDEYCRGLSLNNGNDEDYVSPTMLVGIVEKCFKDYNSDLENRSRKIKDLEDEIIQIKRTLMHDKEKSLHEIRNQLAYVEEQNNYLKQHINEMNESADSEIERLREENCILKTKMEDEMANATGVIDGLEQNLQQLSAKNKKVNESWVTEKKSFEKLLDSNERQMAVIRAEHDQAINQKSSIIAKLDATQNQLADTETSLLQLQSDKYTLEKQIESLRKYHKDMEISINSSRKHFDTIIKTVRLCNDDDKNSNNNFENFDDSLLENDESEDQIHIWKPKKYQIEEIIHLINGLNKREKDADCKYERLKKEYELIEKELEGIDLQRRKIEQSFKAQQLDIDSVRNENSHINSLMANRNGEIERLTAERDYYFQLLNEKTEEVAIAKTEKHRLAATLEERCRMLETQHNFNHSNDQQRSQVTNNVACKDNIIREDRNRLVDELNSTKAAYDDLLSRRDEEAHNVQKIRQENWNLQAELKNACREYDELVAENRKISMKLKDSENEIANLCRELQNNHGAKSRKHTSLEKKVSDLVSELTSSKNELKIAQERIRHIEKGHPKSNTKISQSTILNDQLETPQIVDNLKVTKNRLSSLEQQMLSLDTCQKTLRDENYKLTDLLKKVTAQNERMSEELEVYVEENKKLRNQVSTFGTHYSNSRNKNERKSKTVKEEPKDHRIRRIFDTPLDSCSNDESLKQLREDLQDSIKEAKRLLSSPPLIDSNDDYIGPSKHTDSNNLSLRSSKNPNSSGSNNNNIDRISSSDPVDSSTLNSRRSEVTSLAEADRHISLQVNKNRGCDRNSPICERPSSAIEELLSPNKNQSIKLKKSQRDSYMLEEKIKRLLTTES